MPLESTNDTPPRSILTVAGFVSRTSVSARVNGPALAPVHDWVRQFEHIWNARLDRLDDVVAELQTHEEKP